MWKACCIFCGKGCAAGKAALYPPLKKHRAATKRIEIVGLVRLIQLSAVGEVFLEGTCPLSRCPQTAKSPAPCFWRRSKVGEKSDSFSRAERTKPLRPVSRLLFFHFGNVPVERFQRDNPLRKTTDTARRVPTSRTMLFVTVLSAQNKSPHGIIIPQGASSSALFDSFLIWKHGMHPCPDILRLRPALLRFSAAGYTWQHARFCSARRS